MTLPPLNQCGKVFAVYLAIYRYNLPIPRWTFLGVGHILPSHTDRMIPTFNIILLVQPSDVLADLIAYHDLQTHLCSFNENYQNELFYFTYQARYKV